MTTKLNYNLPQLLKSLVDQAGSDLHISAGSPPRLRISGNLLPLDLPPLTQQNSLDLCYSILTEEQKKTFEKTFELDLAFTVKGLCRFRSNIYLQRGSVGGTFRVIPDQIQSLSALGLPPIVQELCTKPRGLVLVTGPTGSGKSTTLSCMIAYIANQYPYHIITVEDPVEYLHAHKKSLVNQREVGSDTKSFSAALRSALRQDPDVLLIGELRDLETIGMALTAAETGHLVFATLHTSSCVSSITRLVDVFPAYQQPQIRTQLSFNLVGVLSQILVPTVDNKQVVCMEVLMPNAAIRSMIREDKIHQIYSSMQIGQEGTQMKTMNQALMEQILKRRITPQTAFSLSHDVLELRDLMQKNGLGANSSKG